MWNNLTTISSQSAFPLNRMLLMPSNSSSINFLAVEISLFLSDVEQRIYCIEDIVCKHNESSI